MGMPALSHLHGRMSAFEKGVMFRQHWRKVGYEDPRRRRELPLGAGAIVWFNVPIRVGLVCLLVARAASASAARPWDDRSLPPVRRALRVVEQMTQSEKLALVHGGLGAPWGHEPKPPGAIGSAGYVPGVPRLGIPPLQETDAELGIADPGNIRRRDTATAMPSNLALAATWDPALARRQGEAVGAEARAKGFDVLLGGAANLVRDPRGGRNFEYFSEDPLLTGVMAGEAIAGAQSRKIISTMKHFALNAQETDRVVLDARIDEAAMRESDLLAFEIAIEHGAPKSVMCAYNQVNGRYSCENDWLLTRVLKTDWHYPGFVMSDWGAVHSTVRSVLAGLDQESGEQLDTRNFLAEPLGRAVAGGEVPRSRLDDMVTRILTAVFAAGIVDDPPRPGPVETAAGAEAAQAVAQDGIVLLKNDGVLPLSSKIARIAVIGAHADKGVLSGGGSSQVVPTGGIALSEPAPNGFKGALIFDPSPPLAAIRRAAPGATVDYADGRDSGRAAHLAAKADATLVFVDQWMTETTDAPNLTLPGRQDALIAAVARANPRTVVVLETGGPVSMPWLGQVAGVLEAWYPGQRGGEAIAAILFGAADPSGHLPMTFPRADAQLPREKVPGDPKGAPPGPVGRGGSYGRIFTADYTEGAAVGYKWFERQRLGPLFPFGFGLAYTGFDLRGLTTTQDGPRVTASLTIRNTGSKTGAAVPQIYLSRPGDETFPLRLAGWDKVALRPGQERRIEIRIDPRLLARFDETARCWRIAAGTYRVSSGFDAMHRDVTTDLLVDAATLPP